MAIIRIVVIGVAGLFALVFAFGLFLPRTATVERAVTIDATADAVFPHVNSMRAFHEWSPWRLRDPDALYAFDGPDSGVGSRMSWRSDEEDVGAGSQVIVESEPNAYVRTNLEFGGQGDAAATFRIDPAGDGAVTVTWGFEADMGANPLGRYFGLMMDAFVGKDYETGLARLKALVEDGAA